MDLYDCTNDSPELNLGDHIYTHELGWATGSGYFYRYELGAWHRVEDEDMHADILLHLERCYVRKGRDGNTLDRKLCTDKVAKSVFYTTLNRRRRRELEVPSPLFAFRNGTLDIRTGDFLPHDPRHWATVAFDCDWTPGASLPESARRFFMICYGLDQLQTLRAVLRYFLDPTMPYGVFIYLFGQSRSGKGKLMDILAAMLPSHRVGSLNGGIASLASREGIFQSVIGRQVVQIRDMVDASGLGADALSTFYSLVDDEPVSIRRLYKDSAPTVRIGARLVVGSTKMPHLGARSGEEGWAGRVRYLGTKPRPANQRPDPNLARAILDDPAALGGLACWALQMDADEAWRILNREVSDAQTEALHMRAETQCDSVALFLDTCCRPHPGPLPVRLDEIARLYVWWADKQKLRPRAPTNFIGDVRDRLPHLHQPRRRGKDNVQKAADYGIGVCGVVCQQWVDAAPYKEARPVSSFVVSDGTDDNDAGWLAELKKHNPPRAEDNRGGELCDDTTDEGDGFL